jgi:DNA polymerase I-like protein with 3'-5' exonuclease and polymerase domains
MQQLPRKDKTVKKCIRARDGYKIVSGDLGTAEMYIVAALSGDKVLQQVFISGEDYHSTIAVHKFGLPCKPSEVTTLFPDMRQAAKTVSFEILYKLNFDEPILEKFVVLKKWLKARIAEIKENGFIYQAFGRKRRLQNVFSPNKQDAAHELRSGINSLVQGPASDVNLLAAIDLYKYVQAEKIDAKLFGLVHDSILAEVKDEDMDRYVKAYKYFTQMDRGVSIPGCPISVDVEIGQNYAFTE